MTGRIIVIARNDNMPRLSGPNYDATAERWVQPPSCTKQDDGAAAELRQHSERTLSFRKLKSRLEAVPKSASRHSDLLADIFTTAFGLLVFGLIAAFFLVLA